MKPKEKRCDERRERGSSEATLLRAVDRVEGTTDVDDTVSDEVEVSPGRKTGEREGNVSLSELDDDAAVGR